jgi:hypothetical protein
MPRITKAQTEAEARERAAYEAGLDYYTANPDADLTTVHRYASKTYPTKFEALGFAWGYSAGRQRHDEYLKEKGQES